MKLKFAALSAIFLILSVFTAFAEKKLVTIDAESNKAFVKKGETFEVKATLNFAKDCYTYATVEQVSDEGIGPTMTEIEFAPKEGVADVKSIIKPKPKKKYDEGFLMDVLYYKGSVQFTIKAVAVKNIDFSKDKLEVLFYMQICEKETCYPPQEYKSRIKAAAQPVEEQTQEEVESDDTQADSAAATAEDAGASDEGDDSESAAGASETETVAEKEANAEEEGDIFSFLWIAMGAGFFAFFTPCVYPMIPITVSFFTQRSEEAKGKGLRDALVYAVGIVASFTLIGFLFSIFLGPTGLSNFVKSPGVYLFIAAIFVVFAFNFFGAFELQMPSGLMNKLNAKSREGSGIGTVLLMAITFSLASFSCTGPLVGAALISASQGEWFYPIVSMIGFSTVLAFPFFLLALFPSVLKTMPKAGGWMNNMKVVLGFVVLATSLYFLNNALIKWEGGMSRELYLSIWAALTALASIYLLGLFKMKLDSPIQFVSSPRLVFALLFGAISLYFVSGLAGAPMGELETYIPESTRPAAVATASAEKTQWHKDYEEALALANAENKPIFIDFSGVTCTNCKKMERNMFVKPSVVERFEKMVLVKLITDKRGEPYESNKKLQQEKFGSIALPLYVLLTPDGKEIAQSVYTTDEQEFLDFLDKAFE